MGEVKEMVKVLEDTDERVDAPGSKDDTLNGRLNTPDGRLDSPDSANDVVPDRSGAADEESVTEIGGGATGRDKGKVVVEEAMNGLKGGTAGRMGGDIETAKGDIKEVPAVVSVEDVPRGSDAPADVNTTLGWGMAEVRVRAPELGNVPRSEDKLGKPAEGGVVIVVVTGLSELSAVAEGPSSNLNSSDLE